MQTLNNHLWEWSWSLFFLITGRWKFSFYGPMGYEFFWKKKEKKLNIFLPHPLPIWTLQSLIQHISLNSLLKYNTIVFLLNAIFLVSAKSLTSKKMRLKCNGNFLCFKEKLLEKSSFILFKDINFGNPPPSTTTAYYPSTPILPQVVIRYPSASRFQYR